MRTFKVTAAFFVAAMLFAGCNAPTDAPTVPEEQYNALKEKYQELQDNQAALRDNFMDQASEMEKIFQELSSISGKTSALRLDVESGTAQVKQAEQIQTNIEAIRKRIEKLEKLASDKTYVNMVKELKGVLEQKEQEIETLKGEIELRDETIKQHEGTIAEQDNTINLQKIALQQKVNEQAKALYDAGVDFEELADDAPEVTRNKNKEKINEWALSMYEKAFIYYSKAELSGYAPASLKLEKVEAKMNAIRNSK